MMPVLLGVAHGGSDQRQKPSDRPPARQRSGRQDGRVTRSTPQALAATNRCASRASLSQAAPPGGTTAHSFMTRPSFRGSKRVPARSRTSSSTRIFGSFSTRSLPIVIAKILPRTLSATLAEPQPFSTVTPASPESARTTGASAGGTSMAFDLGTDFGPAFAAARDGARDAAAGRAAFFLALVTRGSLLPRPVTEAGLGVRDGAQ